MTDIISPTYSFINLSSVKLYPLGLAPFKVSALTGRFISLEICTNQMSLVATCQNVSLARRHERLCGEEGRREAGFKELQSELQGGTGPWQPLDPEGFTLLNILGWTGGRAVGSWVSETSRWTAPESWRLSVNSVRFLCLFCALSGRRQGCPPGEGEQTQAFWFPGRLGGSAAMDGCSGVGSPGWNSGLPAGSSTQNRVLLRRGHSRRMGRVLGGTRRRGQSQQGPGGPRASFSPPACFPDRLGSGHLIEDAALWSAPSLSQFDAAGNVINSQKAI